MLGASAKWSDDDLRKLKRAFLEIDYNKKETTKGRDGDGIGGEE